MPTMSQEGFKLSPSTDPCFEQATQRCQREVVSSYKSPAQEGGKVRLHLSRRMSPGAQQTWRRRRGLAK